MFMRQLGRVPLRSPVPIAIRFEAARTGDKVAVLFFDLDNFKHINDSAGHHCGDLLLKAVARDLKRIFKHWRSEEFNMWPGEPIEVFEEYMEYGRLLGRFVTDTSLLLDELFSRFVLLSL